MLVQKSVASQTTTAKISASVWRNGLMPCQAMDWDWSCVFIGVVVLLVCLEKRGFGKATFPAGKRVPKTARNAREGAESLADRGGVAWGGVAGKSAGLSMPHSARRRLVSGGRD